MPRSASAPRRADGSSENARRVSEDGAGEEKCTTVAIRLRPLNERENAGNQGRIWRCVPTHNSVTQTSPEGNPLPVGKGNTFFTYDRIFDEDSSTQEVYEGVAQEIVHSVVRGLNGTIFAYGQTSSGKTFTMQGDGENTKTPGIVQMAARDLFDLMGEAPDRVFLMRVSYLEIYQEEIRDLLNPESTQRLQVREDPRKGVYIEAHEEVVSNFSTVLNLLAAGEKQRHVGCTEMNSRSSRSHTLFRLVVESQQRYVAGVHASPEDVDPAVLVATLNLVDLAGSESVRHTGATGIRQKEGGNINRSLLTLSRVIQTLSQGGNAHVNYRDSKLTRILQPSLSGNAGMAIICCATAAEGFLEETRSTFQFAARAKEIKTRATVNEVLDDKAQLRRMSQELAQLKRQHAEGDTGSALVETLQAEKAEQAAKIERLKKLLINTAPADDDVERLMAPSPRYRRSKRSRETWCPGEGGLVLGLNLLEPNSRIATIEEEGLEHLRKRRSSGSQSTPLSKARLNSSSSPPCTPLTARRLAPSTPGTMTPARARAHQEVSEMRERLAALQAERDAKAAEAEAAVVEMARVEQLEQEVSRREAEVLSLKKELEVSSAAAVQASAEASAQVALGDVGADEVRERVEVITAKLEEAVQAKEALEAELTEFGEYTDMKDEEMVDMKNSMAAMEEGLRQKEAELAAIRAAEEKEEAENALRVAELQSKVHQLENAIKERDEAIDGMDVAGADSIQKEEELETLKAALNACQAELAEHATRADGAEEELERLVQELSSTKARLAEEREAAEQATREASDAVLAAREVTESASLREEEAAAASRDQIKALETEKEELLEQQMELRALNDDAAALLAENEAHLSSIADGDAEDALASEAAAAASSAEVESAKQAVVDSQAEVVERDLALAEMQARVEGLAGSLAGAKEQQGREDVRVREEKERADASLAEALAGQRRAEDGLSVACQSQLEMRCRLEDAMRQAEEAEAARDDMVVESSAAKRKEEEEIVALGGRVAEVESLLEAAKSAEALASGAAEQANVAAAEAAEEAEEARRQLAAGAAAGETKDAKIAELTDVIGRLEADGETRSGVEQEFGVAREQMDVLRAEKEEGDVAVAVAQADKEGLVAQVQELTERLAAGVAEAETARDELAAVTAAASVSDAKSSEEIARLVRAVEASSEDVPAVQAQLEAAKAEAVTLAAAVGSLEAQLEAAATTASEREVADAARIADIEDQLKSAVESFESRLASVQEQAAERAAMDAARIAEVEGQMKEALETAALERETSDAARTAEIESQIESVAGSLEAQLAAAQAAASEREAADASRIAEVEGQMKAEADTFEARLAAAEVAASEKEAADAARIAEIEAQTEAAVESFEAQLASFQGATSEEQAADAAHIAEMEAQMEAAVETFEARLAAAGTAASEREAADAARLIEVEAQMWAAGASFEEKLAAAEAAVSEKEVVDAARIAEIESEKEEVVEALEAQLVAVRAAAERKEAEDAARVAEVESQMETAIESFEARLKSVQGDSSEKEDANAASRAEVEGQMKAATSSFEERLEAVETSASEREAADAARIAEVEGQMKEAVESFEARLASAESAASETEAAGAARVAELEGEKEAVVESLEAQLAAAGAAASEREAADAARIAEIEGQMKATAGHLPEALASLEKVTAEASELAEKAALVGELTAELEEARAAAASAAANRDSEEGDARAELERALASVTAKDEEIVNLQEQESEQVRVALAAAAESAAALSQNEAKIEDMKLRLEANESVEEELTQALEDSEGLSKKVLDLTEQVVEKDAMISEGACTVAELREQVEAGRSELAALQASAPSSSPLSTWQAITDGLDEEGAGDGSSEVRRLKVELDKKGSEMDTLMKEEAVVRAELKEMKGMFNAAEAGAGAAGADEDSLRKRLSQLMCENGLLKGEKDRLEAVAVSAAAEAKLSLSRSAAEIEGLEREVGGLRERAEKASRGAADGDRARVAVGEMEAKLSELRQERTDLQNAAQRSLDRVSEAESEISTLRVRLAEAEERGSGRDSIVALETKVDELEEEIRRADASRVEMEGDARDAANRAKRLQGEVDMMRAEYEIVSEEVSGLRGSLAGAEAKLEEAEAQAEAQAAESRSSDRSDQLEADIAQLREERTELLASHQAELRSRSEGLQAEIALLRVECTELRASQQDTLRSEELARTKLQEVHDEAVSALESAISEAMDVVEMKEAELAELSRSRDELLVELEREGERAGLEAGVAAERLAAAEDRLTEAEARLTEVDDASKDTEGQLRHRLNTQVAETENLRQELVSSRERSEQAEAAVRASEQRAREGADKKTKDLLAEMETLCQDKLLAENKAHEMEGELDRLREEVAGAEQTAARDQSMIIRASEERMAAFEQAAAVKDSALADVKAALATALDAEQAATEAVAEITEKARAAASEVAKLSRHIELGKEAIAQKDSRIKRLEEVKLTNHQVGLLQAMKTSARKTAAENKELKQRLAVLEEGADRVGGGGGGSGAGEDAVNLAAATERIAELQGAKKNLMEKLRVYGARVHELDKQHTRVRAAVEQTGVSAPEGRDLGDAVLEMADRVAGRDASMLSSFSGDEGSAIAAAAAAAVASETHQAELKEVREALRKGEAERSALKEQMIAGVGRFRELEARESVAREGLEAAEMEKRDAVNAAVKTKEKDHERQLKFLQEENVTLFQENTDARTQADKYKAELDALKGKLSSATTAKTPESTMKKRRLADRTNVPVEAAPVGKPAAVGQPTAAAARRARSRALLEGPNVVDEEGAGECTQS